MRLHELVTPEANRPRSRLQPKRRGAALVRRDSVYFSDDWRFEQSVHNFDFELRSSRNHKPLLSAKFNQVRLDGEPHNSTGFAFAAAVIDARDEFTERQGFFLAIAFHVLKCKLENLVMLWGETPIR
jgi:hypothetical protein